MARYGIRLPGGHLVTDPEWRSVGDVMRSGHGHGITRVKGDLVELDDDGVPVDGQDLLTADVKDLVAELHPYHRPREGTR